MKILNLDVYLKLKPTLLCFVLGLFLAVSCTLRKNESQLFPVTLANNLARSKCQQFLHQFPPVQLSKIDRVEIYRFEKKDRYGTQESQTILAITNSDELATLYEALSANTSTNFSALLCGHLSRQRWMGAASNVLFRTSLMSCCAELTATFDVDGQRVQLFGRNVDFARKLHDLMIVYTPEYIAKQREAWEKIEYENAKQIHSFWGDPSKWD